MSWSRIVIGFLIMMGVVVVWFRLTRAIKGQDGSRLDTRVGRKRARREGDEPNELERIIAAHRAGAMPADTKPHAASPAADADDRAGLTPSAPATPRVPVLLNGSQKLAYLLFKAALPDHHVLARVALGELLPDVPATVSRGRHVFAAVVCNADFSVAAAVDIRDPATEHELRIVADTLRTRGIRHILLDPRALPRPRDVRALVHGP
jgi:hypothetical protein